MITFIIEGLIIRMNQNIGGESFVLELDGNKSSIRKKFVQRWFRINIFGATHNHILIYKVRSKSLSLTQKVEHFCCVDST